MKKDILVGEELLQALIDKMDMDLSDALREQEKQLDKIYDEKIMSLNAKTLKLEQTMITKKRELAKKMEEIVLTGLEGILYEKN